MGSLANDIVAPEAYADENRLHEAYGRLRRESPVFWAEPDGFRPFWAISKHADILEIERQNDLFINDPRTVLINSEAEERVKEFTGGSHLLLRTLVHMDNPDHRKYRGLTQSWFMPPNLKKRQETIRGLARRFVDGMAARGGSCDFVKDVAVWYPLHVIMSILGVPEEDEARMLKLTQEIFGADDPDMKRESSTTNQSTITDFFKYFAQLTEDRRANPKDDVASVIASGLVDGEPLGHLEAMSYYIIIATAGHDTTSSTIAGGLKALLENPDEAAALGADFSLMPGAVEEMIRWVTPVKHFMRTAREDYVLRGQTIRKGDSLMLLYWSGNRDEEVFDDPFAFRIRRHPNRHLAFGHGAHLCLGMHLARMEIAALFEEMLPRLDEIEIAGETRLVQASFVSGLKQMPIRYRFKS